MPLSLCVMGSGSSGNCLFVGSSQTRILIDAGLSARETLKRCDLLGIAVKEIAAVCVTHEHADHRAALPILHAKHGIKLYANSGTIDAIERDVGAGLIDWQVFTTGVPFSIGDLTLEPFPVPHDSYDPVGFVVAHGDTRVGVVTDMGMATTAVRSRLRGCHAIVMESNYDDEMLRNSTRPWSLKQRIMGAQGHMSNAQACELLVEIAGPQLRYVVLAHISSDCNRPEVASGSMRRALDAAGHGHVSIVLTYGDRPSERIEV